MKLLSVGLASLFAVSAFASDVVFSVDEVSQRLSKNGELKCMKWSGAKLVGEGVLRLEHWRNKEESQWSCRRADNGTFLYGATAELEKFRVKKGENESPRLVFRDGDGQFVTWVDLTGKLVGGWESYGEGNSRYVVRLKNAGSQSGEIVNSAFGRVEDWKGKKVCAVRDTADGEHNGKLLTWILADDAGNFHNPENGRFVSCRNPK